MTVLKKAPKIAAVICLYGNHAIGAGWLANLATPETPKTNKTIPLGDGEPKTGVGFTEAVWAARDALYAAGMKHNALVRIFAAGGLFYAEAKANEISWYGNLGFKPIT